MKIIYPYPMQISMGYSYMLSIIQFLNSLADYLPVELLCLDNRDQIDDYLNNKLGIHLSSNLSVIKISNKKYGIKSNKLFFSKNVLEYLRPRLNEKLYIYTRDFKQMRLLIKGLKNRNENIQFIFEAHQILSQNYCLIGEYKKASKMRSLENFVFSNVNSLICITLTLSNEIKKMFPESIKNHVILPVGFNKKFLDIVHGEKIYDLIYSGNFSAWKGLDILVEAISIVKHQFGREIKAILIGANENSRKQLEQQAENLKITENITFKDRVDHKEIYEYIAQSKLGVLSNKFDADGMLFTSPLKLYEYLGSGLKVVVSRLPSIESAIDPSLVYYATPENPESFAKKILYALNDESFDALNVRNFARDFTWEARARNFVKILK